MYFKNDILWWMIIIKTIYKYNDKFITCITWSGWIIWASISKVLRLGLVITSLKCSLKFSESDRYKMSQYVENLSYLVASQFLYIKIEIKLYTELLSIHSFKVYFKQKLIFIDRFSLTNLCHKLFSLFRIIWMPKHKHLQTNLHTKFTLIQNTHV